MDYFEITNRINRDFLFTNAQLSLSTYLHKKQPNV